MAVKVKVSITKRDLQCYKATHVDAKKAQKNKASTTFKAICYLQIK